MRHSCTADDSNRIKITAGCNTEVLAVPVRVSLPLRGKGGKSAIRTHLPVGTYVHARYRGRNDTIASADLKMGKRKNRCTENSLEFLFEINALAEEGEWLA